ncbi:MAG: DUF2478 domain-containing protein [Rhodospirillales bacterium]|jgi:uncharacterized protein|nr:DUF2478 domain-containing protein [Rhodospirillales bacterium]MBT4040909.1 DUF2478 domain-containing protein [Rhodospirillales bacterium]MBT4625768.1 DUF2478 domain-containing protein [Rhodospirillales bacterium]MBT5521730.1 DUF2478 domain-containing protein [Rhodospirillales bacterium]MBT6110545.1 DUF2478 domain-containing protein [Rhodospirillales bacterium]
MTNDKIPDPEIRLAGAFYTSGKQEMGLLRSFADDVAANGWRVGGIVQELLVDEGGKTIGLDGIALDTGERIAINRPTEADRLHHTCSLDKSALADASSAVDRAIRAGVDLIVIEKYGEQEQNGDGLAGDILHAVSEGIPTLVAVPDGVRDKWDEFSGNLGQDLGFANVAFTDWWDSVKPDR